MKDKDDEYSMPYATTMTIVIRYAIMIMEAITTKSVIAILYVCTTPHDSQPASRSVHEVGHVVQGEDSRSGASGKHSGRS